MSRDLFTCAGAGDVPDVLWDGDQQRSGHGVLHARVRPQQGQYAQLTECSLGDHSVITAIIHLPRTQHSLGTQSSILTRRSFSTHAVLTQCSIHTQYSELARTHSVLFSQQLVCSRGEGDSVLRVLGLSDPLFGSAVGALVGHLAPAPRGAGEMRSERVVTWCGQSSKQAPQRVNNQGPIVMGRSKQRHGTKTEARCTLAPRGPRANRCKRNAHNLHRDADRDAPSARPAVRRQCVTRVRDGPPGTGPHLRSARRVTAF